MPTDVNHGATGRPAGRGASCRGVRPDEADDPWRGGPDPLEVRASPLVVIAGRWARQQGATQVGLGSASSAGSTARSGTH
jgi:hypothetical protein